MATEYPVKIKLQLKPVGTPWVRVGLDDFKQVKQLETLTTFEWDVDAVDQVCLTVELFNKKNDDPTTAVEIVGIEFFGIADPKFAWAGVYCPDYPEPWASEQNPSPLKKLPGQTYLGWNGVYSLTFSVPVFTWIHKTLNLGWIYQ
jgi:hypothetical protein